MRPRRRTSEETTRPLLVGPDLTFAAQSFVRRGRDSNSRYRFTPYDGLVRPDFRRDEISSVVASRRRDGQTANSYPGQQKRYPFPATRALQPLFPFHRASSRTELFTMNQFPGPIALRGLHPSRVVLLQPRVEIPRLPNVRPRM
jgi:hypothetical protein